MPKILGSRIDVLSRKAVEQKLLDYLRVESSTPHFIVTANAEMYYQALKKPELQQAINQAELCVPDSIGIIRALRHYGISAGELYPGVELAEWILAQADSVYVLGAQERVLSRLTQPNIVGRHNGFFTPDEEDQIIAEINRLQPQAVLVALGAGKQELWIARHRQQLKTRVLIGVGGAIDVISGEKRRAPYIWRKWHLEWFYRLLREPWRWRRQLDLLYFWWNILSCLNVSN